MYQVKDVVYLSEEENKEVKSKELSLIKVNHVDNEEEVPSDYSVIYTVGKDIDLF